MSSCVFECLLEGRLRRKEGMKEGRKEGTGRPTFPGLSLDSAGHPLSRGAAVLLTWPGGEI